MMPQPFSSSPAMSARSPSRPVSGKSSRLICDHSRPLRFTAARAASSSATADAGRSRIQRVELLMSSPRQTAAPVSGVRPMDGFVMPGLMVLPRRSRKHLHQRLVLVAAGDPGAGHQDGSDGTAVAATDDDAVDVQAGAGVVGYPKQGIEMLAEQGRIVLDGQPDDVRGSLARDEAAQH